MGSYVVEQYFKVLQLEVKINANNLLNLLYFKLIKGLSLNDFKNLKHATKDILIWNFLAFIHFYLLNSHTPILKLLWPFPHRKHNPSKFSQT